MWWVATVHETLSELKNFAFHVKEMPTLCWRTLKLNRDKYIERLNGIYARNLSADQVEYFHATAKLQSEATEDPRIRSQRGAADEAPPIHSIELRKPDGTTEVVTANHVLIATGRKVKEKNLRRKDTGVTARERSSLSSTRVWMQRCVSATTTVSMPFTCVRLRDHAYTFCTLCTYRFLASYIVACIWCML